MNNFIIIVSGLPRCGTSMMMRMLQAGGLQLLVDNVRKADEDNPLGYFEFEAVKKTKDDPSWTNHARGKAVKMVSMLLYDLPKLEHYRIIFMKRTLKEMLASQNRMLERSKKPKSAVSEEEMERLYVKHLAEMEQWLSTQKNCEVLYVSYNETLKDPLKTAEEIVQFLGMDLDKAGMASSVDSSLYRQRQQT